MRLHFWQRWLPLFLLFTGLLIPVPRLQAAERYFFEAEDMKVDGVNWAIIDHYGGWYEGAPSRGKMLRGSGGGQGTAKKTVTLKAGGAFNLWVRYLDIQPYPGPFTITVVQQGAKVAAQTFDQQSLRLTPDGVRQWGDGFGQFVWVKMPLTLAAGEAEIDLAKADPLSVCWASRSPDCFVITDDVNYEPKVEDFADALYVKVKMGPAQQAPCVIHIWGRKPRGPNWWLNYTNIYKDRVNVGECYTGYDPNGRNETMLTANTESPWFNIAPLLDGMGNNAVQFYAMQQYNNVLPAADFTLVFSRTASDEGIVKTFTRTGTGGGMLVRIDLTKMDEMKDDRALSQIEADGAAKVPATGGRRPVRFPIITGCGIDSTYYQQATLANELQVMKTLGVNGVGEHIDPLLAKSGITKIMSGIIYFNEINGCFSDPKLPEIRAAVKAAAKAMLESGNKDKTVAWMQMDEPGSVSLEHIAGCPKCAATFRAFLKKQGLQPASFGKENWEEILPVKDGKTTPELYYHTVNFRGQVLADFFKIGTDILKEDIPDVKTTANFAEALTYSGNGLGEGVDWFEILRGNALTFGWCEDWLNDSASYQLCGYRADFLRSAARGKEFAMYNVLHSGWDSAAKAVTEIGHGAQGIFYYNYGPDWTAAPDGSSSNTAQYAALHKANYAVGAVEDYLVGAQVPAGRIGFLYPRTTDVWTLDQPYSNFGKDRMGLYLALRHLGYPVDVLTEGDAVDRLLAGYQVLVLTGSHIRRDAALALVQWVKDGGRLFLDAGSFTFDEFNRPLNLDAVLGFKRQPFVQKELVGRDVYELPAQKSLEAISFGAAKLESLCGLQKLDGAPPPDARVLATFTDGSPALLTRPSGKGQLIFCGAFPGLGYMKSGVLAKQARYKQLQDAGQPHVTNNPPGYDTSYLAFLAAALKGVPAPPVTTSDYLVEANLLHSEKGLVVALANWAGKPIANLTIALPVKNNFGKPIAAIGPIKSQVRKDGKLLLTLDIGEVEFVAIPYITR